MATTYTPMLLQGAVYHPIGGTFDTWEKAVNAAEAHHHNRHGGGGAFHVFKPEGRSDVTLIEAAKSNDDPMSALAIYKILQQ